MVRRLQHSTLGGLQAIATIHLFRHSSKLILWESSSRSPGLNSPSYLCSCSILHTFLSAPSRYILMTRVYYHTLQQCEHLNSVFCLILRGLLISFLHSRDCCIVWLSSRLVSILLLNGTRSVHSGHDKESALFLTGTGESEILSIHTGCFALPGAHHVT